MRILWNETLLTGVPNVDQQHRELYRRASQFCERADACRSGRDIVELLDYLTRYAHEHFLEEEYWMAVYACPAAEQNRAEHEDFTQAVATMREMLLEEGPSDALLVVAEQRLLHWLQDHVARVDTQLRAVVPATLVPTEVDSPADSRVSAG